MFVTLAVRGFVKHKDLEIGQWLWLTQLWKGVHTASQSEISCVLYPISMYCVFFVLKYPPFYGSLDTLMVEVLALQ